MLANQSALFNVFVFAGSARPRPLTSLPIIFDISQLPVLFFCIIQHKIIVLFSYVTLLFFSLTSVEEARSMFGQARYFARRMSFVHVAAADFEYKQGIFC